MGAKAMSCAQAEYNCACLGFCHVSLGDRCENWQQDTSNWMTESVQYQESHPVEFDGRLYSENDARLFPALRLPFTPAVYVQILTCLLADARPRNDLPEPQGASNGDSRA